MLIKSLSEVLNTNSLLLLLVFTKNSNVLPVPLILFSFKPLTKEAPSSVPIEKPTLNDPVWVSSTIISIFWEFSFIGLVSTFAFPIKFKLFNFRLIFLIFESLIGSPSANSNSLLKT